MHARYIFGSNHQGKAYKKLLRVFRKAARLLDILKLLIFIVLFQLIHCLNKDLKCSGHIQNAPYKFNVFIPFMLKYMVRNLSVFLC